MTLRKFHIILLFAIVLCSCKQGQKKEEEKTVVSADRKWWKEAIVYQVYPAVLKTAIDGIRSQALSPN
jgi:hypothetical protein